MTRPADLLLNRFDRYVVETGVAGWVYEYRNHQPLPIAPIISSALELGVQLHGDWLHHGSRAGTLALSDGMIHTISPAERFHYSFTAGRLPGVIVGFALYPHEIDELCDGDVEVMFRRDTAQRNDRLLELCAAFRSGIDCGRPLNGREILSELLRFVDLNAERMQRDALLRAKAEIDRHYDRQLYLHQIAAIADMHPTTFSRAFQRRFGVTPMRYRLELRINEAIRLSWSRRDLSIQEIAMRVGFEDMSYFHRVFQQKFGLTASQLGRRHLGARESGTTRS
jgi:AraC-like DNA-binding protein